MILALGVAATCAPASHAQLSSIAPVKVAPIVTADLKKILADLGFQPEETNENIFSITIDRDNLPMTYRLYILDNLYVWMDKTCAMIETPEIVPPAALVRVLKENEVIGPAHFALHRTDKHLHIYEAIENRYLTPAVLRKRIDAFDAKVRKCQDVWKEDNFKATGASLPLPPLPPLTSPPAPPSLK